MLSIIVPLYNESESIPSLYQAVVDALDGFPQSFELIFVNDGSTDDSAGKLSELAGRDERVKIISFAGNFGQTAAMMAGFRAAAGDIIVPMDGDLQNDPVDIPMLVEKLNEGFDVVSGWRKDRQDHSIRRNLPSRIANALISKVSPFSYRLVLGPLDLKVKPVTLSKDLPKSPKIRSILFWSRSTTPNILSMSLILVNIVPSPLFCV